MADYRITEYLLWLGRIPDIEIIRPVIQYCRILFSLILLKLSGRITDNLIFISNKIYIIQPDIRQNRISGPTLIHIIVGLGRIPDIWPICNAGYPVVGWLSGKAGYMADYWITGY